MVNHRVHTTIPAGMPALLGHQPACSHNENTKTQRMFCELCGWVGPGYGPHHRKDVLETWRIHAGDIAMGVDLSHGRAGTNCHCASCARADRLAKEASR